MPGRSTAPRAGDALRERGAALGRDVGLEARTEVRVARRIWGAERFEVDAGDLAHMERHRVPEGVGRQVEGRRRRKHLGGHPVEARLADLLEGGLGHEDQSCEAVRLPFGAGELGLGQVPDESPQRVPRCT